jgi:hypothetical protein
MINVNDIEKLNSHYDGIIKFSNYLEDLKDAPYPSYLTLTIDAKNSMVLRITDVKLIREMVGFAYIQMEKQRKEIIDALYKNSSE